VEIHKNNLKENIFGLKFIPTLGTEQLDDADFIDAVTDANGNEIDLAIKHSIIHPEFSIKNRDLLTKIVNGMTSDGTLKNIFEIGVHRSGEDSSTKCILHAKMAETKYFGVDLNENNLSGVRSEKDNVFCLPQNSSNIGEVMKWVNNYGVFSFDLILIDGFHSIKQVLDDWKYVQYLNKGGIVVFHDSNYHPGPYCVFEAIDDNLFEKSKHFADEEYDWGIALARLK